ncbi:uncharacterized protein VP01_1888g2 [Puccinia sorghi]|uniref:Uncharacterized protein n=1 Tax=Puccinia sorghi TaxID=27349 RepID=A0A0L6VD19_9BASI|nr:uncharacterized protein VP01_1888g2 [Puccinia sorghi]
MSISQNHKLDEQGSYLMHVCLVELQENQSRIIDFHDCGIRHNQFSKRFDFFFKKNMTWHCKKKLIDMQHAPAKLPSKLHIGRLKNLSKHNTSTRKCECPFQVRGLTSRAQSSTNHSWYLVVKHGEHNQPVSHCPSAHPSHQQLALKKKLAQLPAVDMQHAPAKLPSKLHMSAYVDFLAQSLCIKTC